MRKIFVIILLLSISVCTAKAQQEIDTTLEYNQLTISPDTINNWKNIRAFNYAKYLDSLLKEKQYKKIVQPTATGPSALDKLLSSPVTRVVLWILAIAFILFLLYRLFLTQGIFKKDMGREKAATPEVVEEAISSETDFDAMIRQALSNNNYRLAVRYQYLKTLHKLAQKNIVSLAVDKTNYQYVNEINNTQLRNGFARLTLSYEYVWYGEFVIDENIYRKIATGFTAFNPTF